MVHYEDIFDFNEVYFILDVMKYHMIKMVNEFSRFIFLWKDWSSRGKKKKGSNSIYFPFFFVSFLFYEYFDHELRKKIQAYFHTL